MIKQEIDRTGRSKIVIYPDNTPRLTCSRCGRQFVSRGIKDMTLGFTSFGEMTYVPRDDVICYNCEAEDKMANARLIGGPLGE